MQRQGNTGKDDDKFLAKRRQRDWEELGAPAIGNWQLTHWNPELGGLGISLAAKTSRGAWINF